MRSGTGCWVAVWMTAIAPKAKTAATGAVRRNAIGTHMSVSRAMLPSAVPSYSFVVSRLIEIPIANAAPSRMSSRRGAIIAQRSRSAARLTQPPSGAGASRAGEPAAAPAPGGELAAVERDALAHADQAAALAQQGAAVEAGVRVLGRIADRAVVGDLDLEVAHAVAHGHDRAPGPGVAQAVGQALLDDAVGGEVHAGGELDRLALDLQVGLQARVVRAVEQGVEVGERGLGRERGLLLGAAQHAEQPAHLHQRGAAGLLDGGEGVARGLAVVVDHAARGAGLDDHEAHGVRDHVVELARDAGALLHHCAGGALLALGLDRARLLLELAGQQMAVAQRPAGQHGGDEDQRDGEHDVVEPVRVRVQGEVDAEQRGGDDHRDHRVAPRGVEPERVARDQGGDERRGGLVGARVGEAVAQQHGEDPDQHQGRPAPAPEQQQPAADDAERGEGLAAVLPVGRGQHLEQADHRDAGGQQHVDEQWIQAPPPSSQ